MFDTTVPQPPLDSRLNLDSFATDGRLGVPNSLREALLQRDLGEASLLLDALLYAGYRTGKRFTVRRALDDLKVAGFNISPALVRRALISPIFKRQTIQTHRRGRPEYRYLMPDITVLVKKYAKGVFVAVDQLTVSDMQSLRHYRQALHREFIRRAPGSYSRAFLARRLGVSKRTTRAYDLQLGIRSIRRISKQELRYISNWDDLVRMAKPGLNWLRVEYDDGRFFDAPPKEGIATRHMWKMDKKVYLVTQLCNRYVYAPDDDWGDYQFLRLHDDARTIPGHDRWGFRRERMPSDPTSATLMVDARAYQAGRGRGKASNPFGA
jgi:hypothetical protein